MKVGGPSRAGTAAVRKSSGKAGGGSGFAVGGTASASVAESAAGVGQTSPVASVEALIALQEVHDDTQERRRAVKRGRDMLDLLEEIRMGILTGSVPKNRLEQLVRLVEQRRDQFLNPNLAAVLDEIELRARVEIAKLEKMSQ